MANEAEIKAKVEARQAEDQLADLYISESVRIKQHHGEHGLAASIAFFERLRDNLLAIRPLPAEFKPVIPADPRPQQTGFMADECPDGYVEIELNSEMRSETDRAILIGYQWFPKSVVHALPQIGEFVETLAVREWFAEKEGLL